MFEFNLYRLFRGKKPQKGTMIMYSKKGRENLQCMVCHSQQA